MRAPASPCAWVRWATTVLDRQGRPFSPQLDTQDGQTAACATDERRPPTTTAAPHSSSPSTSKTYPGTPSRRPNSGSFRRRPRRSRGRSARNPSSCGRGRVRTRGNSSLVISGFFPFNTRPSITCLMDREDVTWPDLIFHGLPGAYFVGFYGRGSLILAFPSLFDASSYPDL